jgi:hypothetical protein
MEDSMVADTVSRRRDTSDRAAALAAAGTGAQDPQKGRRTGGPGCS